MAFPNETLLLILQELDTRKDLNQCALVNKQWNLVATNSYLYKHIDIYVFDSFIRFIKIISELKSENKRNFGEYIKTISLHFNYIINNDTMKMFQKCCPNITYIQYLSNSNVNKNESIKYKITKNWKHLKHVPTWHYESIEDCLSFYKSTLKHLTLYMKKEDYMVLKDHQLPLNLQSVSKLTNLNELYLSFNKREAIHQININTLNLIHSNCPQLKSLTIANNFRIVNNNNNNNNNTIIPSLTTFNHRWNNINTLSFKNVEVEDPFFFTYLSESYPNMKSLILEKIDHPNDFDRDFSRNAIPFDDWVRIREASIGMKEFFISMKQMMIHLAQKLEKLHVTFGGSYISFPNNQLLKSLSLNPSPYLKDLKLPSTIYPIEYLYEYPQWTVLKCNEIKSVSFIYNLHTLYLSLSCSSKSVVTYLLDGVNDHHHHQQQQHHHHKNRNGVVSPHLKELHIDKLPHKHVAPTIDPYDWLDAFPNLQTLTLRELNIYNENHSYKYGSSVSTQGQQLYKLKKLVIHHSTIKLIGGFNLLYQRCPQLKYFDCTKSRYNLAMKENGITENQSKYDYHNFIYAPQLTFKTFIIGNLEFYGGYPFIYNSICLKTNTNTINDLGKWNNSNNNNDNDNYNSNNNSKNMNEYDSTGYADDIGEDDMYREPTMLIHVRDIEHCKYNGEWISV
ncbi:unnamed protein product [Cunninghamella blakesleeana]